METNRNAPQPPASDQEIPSEEDMRLPPRRTIHARDTAKATRVFQLSLVLLLAMLTVGFIVWHQLYGL